MTAPILSLTAAQSALLAQADAAMKNAFESGVNNSGAGPLIVNPLNGYAAFTDETVRTLLRKGYTLTVAGILSGLYEAFTDVSVFTNSWVAFGSGLTAPGFRRAGPRVELRGTMKNGTVNSPAFTLPSGYTPSATIRFPVASNGALGIVEITSGGLVTLTSGSNVSVSLDGINFGI